jgi:hypothetical protein
MPDPRPAKGRHARRGALLGLVVALVTGAVGFAAVAHDRARPPARAGVQAAPEAGATASASAAAARDRIGCVGLAGFDCAASDRLRAAAAYVAARRGRLGILVRDRRTGAVWRAGATGHRAWTASTIKLAIATDLLERQRAGRIRLTAADRAHMAAMLATSSNPDTDALWDAYGGDAMADTFRRRFGMRGLVRVSGGEQGWHAYQCTGEDLLGLVDHALTDTDPADRAYLERALRTVAGNQRWGVWAAGPALAPGNKNGWAFKPGPAGRHWVTHSVGFAGPDARYAVVVTDDLPPGLDMATGVREVSTAAALALTGRPPAG